MNAGDGINAKPSFSQWFDPHDMDHIHAYHILQTTGAWPKGFVPERIYMEPGWQYIIAFKLGNAWIDYMLRKEV